MLKIHQLTLGMYQTNTYIIHDDAAKTCVVIDPGYEARTIAHAAANAGLEIEAILLTHGHFDHVGAARELAMDTDCPVYIHAAESTMPPMLTAGDLSYARTYGEGDCLHLAGLDIYPIHTPGHTPGSVCLLMGKEMFSGDTLFACSFGRTDLPGGDPRKMMESLRRLASLQGNFFIHPGHGGSTTLDAEKRFNPYMH